MLEKQKQEIVKAIAVQLAVDVTCERYKKETSENWGYRHIPKNRYTLMKEYGKVLGGEIEKTAYDLLRKENDIYESSPIYKFVLQADERLDSSTPPAKDDYIWGYFPGFSNSGYYPILEYIDAAAKASERLALLARRQHRSLCVVDDVAVLPPEEFTLDPSEPDAILCNYGFMGYTENIVEDTFVTPRACDIEHVLAVVCTDGRWYLIRDITDKGDVFITLPCQFVHVFSKNIEDYRREQAEKEQQD